MPFFTFYQNNSGGVFDGPAHYVIVEASDAEEAATRAETVGVYFNGVEDGLDCECCGDRWYPPSEGDGTEVPEIYGQPAAERASGWMAPGTGVCVHSIDGSKAWY